MSDNNVFFTKIFFVFFLSNMSFFQVCTKATLPEVRLMPEQYPVWVMKDRQGVETVSVRDPEQLFGLQHAQAKFLPVFNDYLGNDGGYMAVYTHQKEGSIYQCDKQRDIYLVALIRVKGHYKGSKFIEDKSISKEDLTKIAYKYLPELKGIEIWFGGATGGLVGKYR